MRQVRTWVGVFLLLAVVALEAHGDPRDLASADSFALGGAVGARATGVSAIPVNPAAAANIAGFEIGIFYGSYVLENNSFMGRYDQVKGYDLSMLDPLATPEDAGRLKGQIQDLIESDIVLESSESFGVALAFRGFSFGAYQYDVTEATPRVDAVNLDIIGRNEATSIAGNETFLDIRGIEMREFALSYAIPFGGFTAAATTRYVQGETFWREASVFASDLDTKDIVDGSFNQNARTDDAISGDLSFMFNSGGVRGGILIRNVVSGSFASREKGVYELDRQWRASIAFNVTPDLVLSFDHDLVAYETLLLGRDRQRISGGAEVILGKVWNLRFGLFHDFEAKDSSLNFGFGFGLMLPRFKLEAGVIRSDVNSPLHVALNLRLGI